MHFSRAHVPGDGEMPSSEQLRAMQRRSGPPDNELPGAIAFHAVVARSDEVVVAVVRADAYSTGVSMSVAIRLRHDDPTDLLAQKLFGHRSLGNSSRGELLLGIAYPDGRTATNVSNAPRPDPFSDPDVPTLTQGGGGGGGRSFNIDYWLTPLPPPGDLTIVVAWPPQGIDESRTVLPAQLIADGLSRNVELWPWEPPADHDERPAPEPPVLPEGGWFAEHAPGSPPHTSDPA